MEKTFIFLLIALHLKLTSCRYFYKPIENVDIGFEFLRHETPEQSNQQICLLVNGSVHHNIILIVNSHVGVADESDYTPLDDLSILIPPGVPKVCITVIITNDIIVEANETFTLTLEEPTGGLRNGITINPNNNGTIIRIIDNDMFPNCKSFLRFVRPHLFQHCDSNVCTYSAYSNWVIVPDTEVLVPPGICESGAAHTRQHHQTAPEQGCPVKTEKEQICILSDSERLIHTFNLGQPQQQQPGEGGRGGKPGSPGPLEQPGQLILSSMHSQGRRKRQQGCSSTRACQDITTNVQQCTDQYACKSKHENKCDLRSMVFVLDTSGSIGETDFQKMTNAISNFVPLLCDNMKIAIISYSRDIHVEFCFNCHDLCKDCFTDRLNVVSAIQGIQYRGGDTHTGFASRCVSDYILNPSSDCGADVSSNCLDIIYITDGQSNGPLQYPQTCEEATCLRNHPTWCGKVNTYAIAIGSGVKQEEIDCITQNDEDSVFNVDNFDQFEDLIQKATDKLYDPKSGHLCVEHTDKDILL